MLPGFRATIERYVDEMSTLARKMVGAIALSLGLRPDSLDRYLRGSDDVPAPAALSDAAEGRRAVRLGAAYRLRLHHPSRPGRRRRPRGQEQGRRMGAGAAGPRFLRDECRRYSCALVQRPVRLDAAPRDQSLGTRALFAAVLLRPVDGRDDRGAAGLRAGRERCRNTSPCSTATISWSASTRTITIARSWRGQPAPSPSTRRRPGRRAAERHRSNDIGAASRSGRINGNAAIGRRRRHRGRRHRRAQHCLVPGAAGRTRRSSAKRGHSLASSPAATGAGSGAWGAMSANCR